VSLLQKGNSTAYFSVSTEVLNDQKTRVSKSLESWGTVLAGVSSDEIINITEKTAGNFCCNINRCSRGGLYHDHASGYKKS